jgi:cytochrome c5
VKKIALMLAAVGFAFASAAVVAKSTAEISPEALGDRGVMSKRATIERLTPVGKVCVEGKACEGVAAAAAAAAPAAGGAARSGEEIYNSNCAACHGTGAAGAPKHGDKAAWGPRVAKGKATLYKHAMEGFNAMPPKGMCMTCSEEEIHAAVDFVSK